MGKKEGALGIAKVTGDFPRDLRWAGMHAESFWSLPVRSILPGGGELPREGRVLDAQAWEGPCRPLSGGEAL